MSKSILEIKLQSAINAATTLAQTPLYKEVVETWLTDNEELHQDLMVDIGLGGLPPLDIVHGRIRTEYHDVYRHFTELMEYFRLEQVCKAALKECDKIISAHPEISNNEPLTQWVRQHEMVGLNEYLVMSPLEGDMVNYVFNVYGTTYFLPGQQLEHVVRFHDVFNSLFWKHEILPDSIAKKEEEWEQQRQEQFDRFRLKTRNKELICEVCKPLGYCKNYPHFKLPTILEREAECPYDDID